MRGLCLVVTAFCSLLLGYAEPHAGVFHRPSANLRAPRLSETTIDRRRLKSQFSRDTTVVVPQTPLMTETTDGTSGTIEERLGVGIDLPSLQFSSAMLDKIQTFIASAIVHPWNVYEKLLPAYFKRRSLKTWLTYIHENPGYKTPEQALDVLTTNRKDVEVVELLLLYRKDKGIQSVVNKMLKLAIRRTPPDSDELPKVLLDLKVSAAEALDLFGLNTRDALADAPELAITWLKFTELLRKWERHPPIFSPWKDSLEISMKESANLLFEGKNPSTVDAFIGKVGFHSDLKDFVSLLRLTDESVGGRAQLAKHGKES